MSMLLYIIIALGVFAVSSFLIGEHAYRLGVRAGVAKGRHDAEWLFKNMEVEPGVFTPAVVEVAGGITTPAPSVDVHSGMGDEIDGLDTYVDPMMIESFKEYRQDNPLAPFGPWHTAYKSLED